MRIGNFLVANPVVRIPSARQVGLIPFEHAARGVPSAFSANRVVWAYRNIEIPTACILISFPNNGKFSRSRVRARIYVLRLFYINN